MHLGVDFRGISFALTCDPHGLVFSVAIRLISYNVPDGSIPVSQDVMQHPTQNYYGPPSHPRYYSQQLPRDVEHADAIFRESYSTMRASPSGFNFPLNAPCHDFRHRVDQSSGSTTSSSHSSGHNPLLHHSPAGSLYPMFDSGHFAFYW